MANGGIVVHITFQGLKSTCLGGLDGEWSGVSFSSSSVNLEKAMFLEEIMDIVHVDFWNEILEGCSF